MKTSAPALAIRVPAGDPDRLAVGDLLSVELTGVTRPAALSMPLRIAADGTARLVYLADPLRLAGKVGEKGS
jgi:hypothetical protein